MIWHLCIHFLHVMEKTYTFLCNMKHIFDTEKSNVLYESKQELKGVTMFGINTLFTNSHVTLGLVLTYGYKSSIKRSFLVNILR
jgi:hypothetical protein